jgi:hypothetical protein
LIDALVRVSFGWWNGSEIGLGSLVCFNMFAPNRGILLMDLA